MKFFESTFSEIRACNAGAWNDLVDASGHGVHGLDISSTIEWHAILLDKLKAGQIAHCIVAEENGELAGVMPLIIEAGGSGLLKRTRLSAVSEIYSNRAGFIARDPMRFCAGLLPHMLRNLPSWDEFSLTVAAASESEHALLKAAEQHGLTPRLLNEFESPYIEFEKSWDDSLATLPKKFRWLLRTSRSKLEAAGKVEYRAYRKPDEIERFIAEIEAIERASWKEGAGTSITTNDYQRDFYHSFLPVAALRGWLSGHVLSFDDEPIAYILGVEHGGVCVDLKESYKDEFRARSPGHVLKTFAFPELIARGVSTYDYSGLCEPYKMKWTDKTYCRRNYVVHGRTLKGRVRSRLEPAVTAHKK